MIWVAFDPGGTTGWATFVPGAEVRYRSGEVPSAQVWAYLESVRLLPPGEPPQAVIHESFRVRRMGVDLSPVKVEGVIEEWCRQNGVRTFAQSPAQAKFYWADDKLKDMGLYKPGKPHANDAMRHLLYFVYFSKRVSVQHRGQPPTALAT